MRYENYKRKNNQKIKTIAFFIIISFFAIYYYKDILLKILIWAISIAIIATLIYLLFRNKKSKIYEIDKQKELEEKREKIQKYCDMEKQFFNHQKNIPTPKTTYQENKKRGNDYEEFVGAYYERQGYQVTYHGLEKGRKDGGIDLIAENEYETLLIQCKAWQKAIVKQKHIKEFIGNCTIFLENNPQIATKIKRVFVTSSEAEDKALTKYLQENQNKIEFIIMPF